MEQEVHHPRWTVFLCEQDGEAERALKARLVRMFRSHVDMIEAYLVRVQLDISAEPTVALCLTTDKQVPDVLWAKIAQAEFSKLFGGTRSLNIIFLTPVQVRQISAVARPFYQRHSPTSSVN